ncbi:MAG: MinD/ParA family protein [Halanaeroarchaeum sp.]
MLAIAGGKGGVGKTTTALGVGVALAARRRDPIVVDADVDLPNLHLVANVPDSGVEALAEGTPVDSASDVSRRFDGIRVLGSTPGAPIDRALRRLGGDGPVVVDSPAGASHDAVLPLRMADAAVVVTTADPESIQDARKTVQIARRVGTDVVAFVVNRSSTVPDRLASVAGQIHVVPVPATSNPPLDARRAYDGAVSAWVNP